MARLKVAELSLDLLPDRAEIHARLADGTARRCYRVKSSHLSGEILFNRLARELGLTVTTPLDCRRPIGAAVATKESGR